MLIIENCDTVYLAHLLWLVYGFHINSYSFGIVGVFRIVTIEPGHSLLHHAWCLLPVVHERSHFREVHERDIVDVSVRLAVQYDCGWETLIAHTLRERLVIGALVVNFVAELSKGNTILTLLIWLMLALALWFHFLQEMLKTLMLYFLAHCLWAVGTLLTRCVIASALDIFEIFLSNTKAVQAFGVRSMIAVPLLDLFVCFWLICWLVLLQIRAREMILRLLWRGSVDHFDITGLLLKLFWLNLWLSLCHRGQHSVLISNMNNVSIPKTHFVIPSLVIHTWCPIVRL